jgi:membrane protein
VATPKRHALVLAVLRDALRLFSGKGARFLGAAVSFYALLSAAPLFVVLLHGVGAIFGRARAESALWGGLGTWLSPDGLATIRELTERVDRVEASSGVLGGALVIYGSTRLFRALRRALNELWDVDLEAVERRRSRARRYALRYGGAIALTAFSGVLVAALMLVKSAFALMGSLGAAPPDAVLWALDGGVSIGLAFVLFTVHFRFVPETDVTLGEAAASGAVTTLLFALGSSLVSLYLRHKKVADLYAGASAVVLTVLWVYYSTQVFFLGACVGAALRKTTRS